MLITQDLFGALLDCETKAFLKSSRSDEINSEFIDWQAQVLEEFEQKCWAQLLSELPEDEYLIRPTTLPVLTQCKYRLLIDCTVEARGIRSQIHAVELPISTVTAKQRMFTPIRFVPREKITKRDKLLLAFDALALSEASGNEILVGKIIYGNDQKSVRVQLSALIETVRSSVKQIASNYSKGIAPKLILNRHCAECCFQPRCRQAATESDDLSLLSRMSKKELLKHRERGIHTVTQLSYTFRPRRRARRFAGEPEKQHHALRALAIRERKTHIVGQLELGITGKPLYLDVEGVPDQDFYYLIGLRSAEGDSYVRHSFWANTKAEEEQVWHDFLQTIGPIENPQLIYYGSYEKNFLTSMKRRYSQGVQDDARIDKLIAESVNILSVLYSQVYFPTYSNSLKEVACHLGFQWSEPNPSGLNALIWRSKWEISNDPVLKQRLIAYNAEDCEALEIVTNAIAKISPKEPTSSDTWDNENFVKVSSLKRKESFRFGKNDFVFPEFERINLCAYWNYQRDRIYVSSGRKLKQSNRTATSTRGKALRPNIVIECAARTRCPKCGAIEFYRHGRYSRTVFDLRFMRSGVKRWIVRFCTARYHCLQCRATFLSRQWRSIKKGKFGPDLISFVVYQTIELRLPQRVVGQFVNELFGIDLNRGTVNRLKAKAAQFYELTYAAILKSIVTGPLLHIDETRINIAGGSGYVWVFTSLDSVAFYFTETREGDFLQSLFGKFNGVIVSDFYAAYDSLKCPQQRCLIHLIRDLNEDLLKQPFNEELRELARGFGALLKSMVETIDRFGLKSRFLRRHKAPAERFLKIVSECDYKTEPALKYQKRFDKNRDRLFTFLNCDGVPWNNNNAEHAIKAFALIRNVIRGSSSEKGIRDYLTLLSISETCKCKGVNFLAFLRSGETTIDRFAKQL